jgi:NUMOD4 motif/HNH endonuclease
MKTLKKSPVSNIAKCASCTTGQPLFVPEFFIMENQEIWRDINGYEGLYQVSNLGNVRSLDRTIKHYTGSVSVLNGRLKSKSNSRGYLIVGLCKNGRLKSLKVHRLVAEAFIPNPENKPEVNHLSGNKSDNNIDNLTWATPSENIYHAHKTGLNKGSHLGLFGSKNSLSKPVLQFDKLGNKIAEYAGIAEAYRATSIFAQNICYACNGKYKQAGGYTWKYKEITNDK